MMRLKLSTALIVALGLTASACYEGEEVSVNEQVWLRKGDELESKGPHCWKTRLSNPRGRITTGFSNGDYTVEEGPEGDFFVVRVYSKHELLTTRQYDAVMLRSGQVDEFEITTHSQTQYVFKYWGSPCEAQPENGAGGGPASP